MEGRSSDFNCTSERYPHIDNVGCNRAASRNSQCSAHGAIEPLHFAECASELHAQRRIIGQFFLDSLKIDPYRREWISNLVSQRRRELSNCNKCLPLR